MSVFDTVKENVTARQVAEYYGIKVNRNSMCICPFHKDKYPSMKIDSRYYCFGCGEKGDAVDFTAKYFGIGLKDAALKICDDFHLSYDEKNNKMKMLKPKKTDEQIFREAEKHCYIVLCDYLHLLQKWKTEYVPVDENNVFHPYYLEALKEIDHVEYLLDTLLNGDISDRAFLISDYGRKVKEIEGRMEQLISRGKGTCNGSCKGDCKAEEIACVS